MPKGAGRPARRPAPPHAVIGFVHPGEVRTEFCTSLLDLAMMGRVRIEEVMARESGPNISAQRNMIAARFVDECTAPWLLMVDTDMVFAASALARLIAAADPVDRPIVGGLCFSPMNGETYPTMYNLVDMGPKRIGFVRPQVIPDDQLVQVSATGTGFLLMHRSALEKVRETSGDIAAPWFRESAVGEPMALMGEDLTFCLRAGSVGIPIYVHTGIQVGHMKPAMIGKVI